MRLGLGLALSGGGLPAFYPDATLALDFVSGAYRVGAGGFSTPNFSSLPGLTVSRASVGYAERQDGTLVQFGNNVARITDKGLLVEESRTNGLVWSQDFTNAAWAPTKVSVTAAATTAPDGTLTGQKIAENTTTVGIHQVVESITFTATSWTFSVYVKPAERTWVFVQQDTVPSGSYFNLSGAGSLGSTTGTAPTSRTITAYPNGWYRISITFTAAAGGAGLYIAPATGDLTNSYAGSVGSGIYAWGAQAEAGAFPTSYTPTTSASATRAADGVSVAVSGWSAMTLLGEYSADANSKGVLRTLPVAAGSYVSLDAAAGVTTGWFAAGVNPGGSNIGVNKAAITFDSAGNFRAVRNGGTVQSSAASDYTGGATSIDLGAVSVGGSKLNNYLRRLIATPGLQSGAQIQALTQ